MFDPPHTKPLLELNVAPFFKAVGFELLLVVLQRFDDLGAPESDVDILLALQIIKANSRKAQWGLAYLPPEDREEIRALITPHYAALEGHQDAVTQLVYDIGQLLPKTPLDPEIWQRCRASILSIVRQQTGIATEQPVVVVIDGLHTLDWTYDRWLRAKDGDRSPSTISLLGGIGYRLSITARS